MVKQSPAHARNRRFNQIARERNREYLLREKLAVGRCECGDCDHRVTIESHELFHFDHIDPSTKVGGLSWLANQGVPLERLVSERAKCKLLYYKCHKKRTAKQQQLGFKFPEVVIEWDLFSLPSPLQDIDNRLFAHDPIGDDIIHFSRSTMRKEGEFLVTRNDDGHVMSCHRISDGVSFCWHKDVGYYEDMVPNALLQALLNKH
jgi:hypothetical protein